MANTPRVRSLSLILAHAGERYHDQPPVSVLAGTRDQKLATSPGYAPTGSRDRAACTGVCFFIDACPALGCNKFSLVQLENRQREAVYDCDTCLLGLLATSC